MPREDASMHRLEISVACAHSFKDCGYSTYSAYFTPLRDNKKKKEHSLLLLLAY